MVRTEKRINRTALTIIVASPPISHIMLFEIGTESRLNTYTFRGRKRKNAIGKPTLAEMRWCSLSFESLNVVRNVETELSCTLYPHLSTEMALLSGEHLCLQRERHDIAPSHRCVDRITVCGAYPAVAGWTHISSVVKVYGRGNISAC